MTWSLCDAGGVSIEDICHGPCSPSDCDLGIYFPFEADGLVPELQSF